MMCMAPNDHPVAVSGAVEIGTTMVAAARTRPIHAK